MVFEIENGLEMTLVWFEVSNSPVTPLTHPNPQGKPLHYECGTAYVLYFKNLSLYFPLTEIPEQHSYEYNLIGCEKRKT